MSIAIQTALVISVCMAVVGLARTSTSARLRNLTVHEWGTFTSVAGQNGDAIPWLTLDGPTDLPCFVTRTTGWGSKATMVATVRMETPVLYFYAASETSVDVHVGFRQGLITEYFPAARLTPARLNSTGGLDPASTSSIAWQNVRIQPHADPAFAAETRPNHYYAARATDAAPLTVGLESERFLFYRGIASFQLPVSATIGNDDAIIVKTPGDETIPALMLFENRGGRIGHRAAADPKGRVTLARAEPNSSLEKTRAALEKILITQGLYPREAAAMIETWRDSWFSEGTRLFYVVPSKTVNDILPLRIDPVPTGVVRVFVGRLELATEATLTEIKLAAEIRDYERLSKYRRFLRPFAERFNGSLLPAERARLHTLIERQFGGRTGSVDACQTATREPGARI